MRPNETFGELVKKLRISKQLSQEELAHYCKKSRKHMSDLENDKAIPTYDLTCTLAEKLEIKPSLLFNKLGEMADQALEARKPFKKDTY
ncbi:helix-turn-helix transcriptional regulator [Neobacillus cucumis]|uniref:helix-turn-helix domain-containing protein n=1 Tax=Neobacillus cucumis TaxID=1740721 RepID=UPI0018DF8676|nr:helix-turn-helix transcriptional regulator [Neobacillus cucumis]MBI0577939.1 helix-turn-helix transcriptional regulator [Neobacillus cucumis]